jgi:hypothetical protein
MDGLSCALGRRGLDGGRRLGWLLLVTSVVAGVLLLPVATASGATYQVTSTADSGSGSLRDAILAANANPGADTITFAPSVTGTIALASPLPAITDTAGLTIQGPGAGTLTISGGSPVFGGTAFQILNVIAGASLSTTGLTIADGGGSFGGAISNAGDLSVTDCVLSGNVAGFTSNFNDGMQGGAIYNSGTATISTSTFLGNSAGEPASGEGGAIYNNGVLTVSDSTFSANFAGSQGGGVFNASGGDVKILGSTVSDNTAHLDGGGGIFNWGTFSVSDSTLEGNAGDFNGGGVKNVGSLTLSDSTLSENQAPHGDGGGIVNFGSVTVTNSTFDGNMAVSPGGGIDNAGTLVVVGSTFQDNTALERPGGGLANGVDFGPGTAAVSNSTFSGNSGAAGAGGAIDNGNGTLSLSYSTVVDNTVSGGFAAGGGIFVGSSVSPAATSVEATIVADNTGGDCGGGALTDAGYNISSDTSCSFTSATSQVTDPLLGPLADNGGLTKTMLPSPGSPAIDQIPDGLCTVGTDQRGVSRPQGPACDIGAVEVQDNDLALTNLPGSQTVNATSPLGASVTYTPPAVLDEDKPLPTVSCLPAPGSTFPIGVTTVHCTATATGDSNSPATVSFMVTVRGAPAQLQDLLAAVAGVGPGKSLADKIQHIQTYVAANRTMNACRMLSAFINEVSAQTGKTITAAQRASFTKQATNIGNTLGC